MKAHLLLLWLVAAPVILLVEARVAGAGPAAAAATMRARLTTALAWHGGEPGAVKRFAGHAVPVLAAVILVAAGLAAGRTGVRWLGLPGSRGAAVWLAVPAGLGALAAVMHGLGLCGLFLPMIARALLAGAAFAGWRVRKNILSIQPSAGVHPLPTLGALALLAIPALSPMDHVDARIYHLAVPGWYAEAHKLVARPDWTFAGYSQDHELLGLLGSLATGDDRCARMLGLAAAAGLGVLLLARVARPGFLPVALLLTGPMLADLAGTSKNDLLYALASLAALGALERGLGSGSLRWLALAGWLGGAAHGFKNLGVFTLLGLGAVVALDPRFQRRRAGWAALTLGAVVPVIPYALRNGLFLGAPAYPFLLGRFPPVGWTPADTAALGEVFNARDFSVGSPGRLLASPLHALTALCPFALALLPVALSDPALRRLHGRALAFTAAWFLGWTLLPTGGVARFLLPLVPLVLAASLDAVAALPPEGLAARLARAYLPILVGWQVLVVVAGWAGAPLGCALGTESARAWRARNEPVWTEALGWMEAPGNAGGTVALVGQGVQHPRPLGLRLWAHEIEHAPPVRALVHGARDEARLAVAVRQQRLTAVLYNLPAANFWGPYAARYPWTPREVALWGKYWRRHAVLAAASSRWSGEEGFLLLYRLAARAHSPVPLILFLPGTEAVFVEARRGYFDGRPVADLLPLLAPYQGAFEGIAAYGLRTAILALDAGRAGEAAAGLRTACRALSAEERAVCRFFGEREMPWGPDLPRRLAAGWPASRLRTSDEAALALNFGLPLAVVR